MGIYHYTRDLLHSWGRYSAGNYELLVTLNTSNSADMLPDPAPSWMTAAIYRTPRSTLRRLWTDHVSVSLVARQHEVPILIFPKGWTPLFKTGERKLVAIVHDDILGFYQVHYPRFLGRLKAWYFGRMLDHTLEHADQILTVSETSARQLRKRKAPDFDAKCRVIGEGIGAENLPSPLPPGERRGILVIGSRFPHKATHETLRLVKAYIERTGFGEPVYVTGVLAGSSSRSFIEENESLFKNLGFLEDSEFFALMGRVRVLVLLSEIEGFGRPLLEAYLLKTPVVYRDAHSFKELMGPTKSGAWDGLNEDTFVHAMQQALHMHESEIDSLRLKLSRENNWIQVIQRLEQSLAALS